VQQRIEELFGISSTIYSLLYSFYSLPNIIVPMIAGMMLKKIGNGKGLVVCSIFVVFG
jgi:MFS family permease